MDPAELHELLRGRDLTGAWLARRLDVTRSLVAQWLRGEKPIPAGRVEAIRNELEPIPAKR